MSRWSRLLWSLFTVAALVAGSASADKPADTSAAAPSGASPAGYAAAKAIPKESSAPEAAPGASGAPGAEGKSVIKPYRTWITIQRYSMDNNGEPNSPISNVRIEVTWPNGQKLSLPEGGQYWPIGNGQVQEINRTFEIPYAWVRNDGFVFTVQMVRKGSQMLPCQFEVAQLSAFNRSYVCHTDTNWQANNHTAPENLDKEGIQVRVFTDIDAKPTDIPSDAIALK